jgi:hypothetical protein
MAVSDTLGLAAGKTDVEPATCGEKCCPCFAEILGGTPSSALELGAVAQPATTIASVVQVAVCRILLLLP